LFPPIAASYQPLNQYPSRIGVGSVRAVPEYFSEAVPQEPPFAS
jgi:hypothetical protein